MIVRDEERFLDGCLRSLRDLVDEIVVVDTGSSDATLAIARSHGAQVSEFAWCDDFSAARNAALERASGDWILYIDADERVVDGDRSTLAPLLDDPAVAALTVRFRAQLAVTPYREHRLFRRRPDVRFRGLIHETHLPDLFAVCDREGLRLEHSPLSIEHLGYEGDLAHKHRRNLPLLRARLARDPGHVYSHWHLGATLAGAGDEAAAEEAWRRGVEVVRARRTRTLADSLPHTELVRCRLARGEDVSELLDEALRWFPDNYTLVWLQGRAWLAAERFADALAVFARLAATDPERVGGTLGHDRRIFGEQAFAGAGLCCFRLGRFAEAAVWYGRAEQATADNLEYRLKRTLAERRAAAQSAF